jgi:hypothetical protein
MELTGSAVPIEATLQRMPHHGAAQPQIDALSKWFLQRPNVTSVEAAKRFESGGLLLRAPDGRGFPVANLEVSSIVLQDYPEPADLLNLLDTGSYRQKLRCAGVPRARWLHRLFE